MKMSRHQSRIIVDIVAANRRNQRISAKWRSETLRRNISLQKSGSETTDEAPS
jgi:hypothetical protein